MEDLKQYGIYVKGKGKIVVKQKPISEILNEEEIQNILLRSAYNELYGQYPCFALDLWRVVIPSKLVEHTLVFEAYNVRGHKFPLNTKEAKEALKKFQKRKPFYFRGKDFRFSVVEWGWISSRSRLQRFTPEYDEIYGGIKTTYQGGIGKSVIPRVWKNRFYFYKQRR